MTLPFRLFLTLALSLSIAIAGQGLAASKGAAPAVGQMVLCTGTGPVVVPVDAQGQPTAPPHLCPDCALLALAGLAPADTALLPFATPARLAAPLAAVLPVTDPLRRAARARGPPVRI